MGAGPESGPTDPTGRSCGRDHRPFNWFAETATRSSRAANHMRRGLMYNDSLFNAFARSYEARSETDMPMTEYLESCRGDPMRYANAAERLKLLMEVHPIYVLKAGDELSPVFESPLSLFDPETLGPMIEEKYGIPRRRLSGLMSPWCYKRLEAFGGDISRFRVAKIQPSRLRQIAVAKTEPGDENNQDISSLVGKVDIRKLETYAQNDPDAYSYSGGLNRANQGILEFVEMFKAPIKMLHPLLTATQESNYIGTENIGAIPFNGIVLAHSNESEWQSFKANKNNEAFIDRICVIKVPYCLRVTEEQKIYEKLIQGSELASAPCAPAT